MVIDDVFVRQGRRNVELDVRVRNDRGDVANITRAELRVLERVPFVGQYRASARYDLLLDGDVSAIPVAHVLAAGEVDRFTVRVGFARQNTSCGFEARLVLRYNGSEEALSQDLAFHSAFE